jgi:hypothetical protein
MSDNFNKDRTAYNNVKKGRREKWYEELEIRG